MTLNDELLTKVKRHIAMTWEDSERESRLMTEIESAKRWLRRVGGEDIELTYADGSAELELLLNRVWYADNQVLDQFEDNYAGLIAEFQLECEVMRHEEAPASS